MKGAGSSLCIGQLLRWWQDAERLVLRVDASRSWILLTNRLVSQLFELLISVAGATDGVEIYLERKTTFDK